MAMKLNRHGTTYKHLSTLYFAVRMRSFARTTELLNLTKEALKYHCYHIILQDMHKLYQKETQHHRQQQELSSIIFMVCHRDYTQVANFENKVIEELLSIIWITKSRTMPYHPLGNGERERFIRTILNILDILDSKKKAD